MLPVTIHHLVPDFILQNFRAGNRKGEFTGVGMFVDISGFSKMTDTLMDRGQHGAEVLATVMRAVFTPLIQAVYEHEGFVATLAGDAFTALFPFERMADAGPICEEVVQAAWEIQQYIAENALHVTPYGTYPISAKIGIAYGDVSWGIVTSENGGRAAYYFRGSAVEASAEVEHTADAGEIILDRLVCEKAPATARVEPHGGHYRLVNFTLEDEHDSGSWLEWGTMVLPTELGDIVRFFPEGLVLQEHTGEFRQVVNLFIQMPTIQNETELEAFMRVIFSLQNRYGGLLNRVDFGDKGAHLLMFWGAPVAFRNDIGRALNFVLDLQNQTSLPFTAGLTYRISHAGFIGSPLREEYTCYGRGVNLAARFMISAPRGEIWVDDEISRRIGSHFELESLGDKVFKGFNDPQGVSRLIDRKEQAESSLQSPFIGREAEMAELVEFIQPLLEGKFGGAIIISGEAGIGKTRLVNAFRAAKIFQNLPAQPLFALCQNDQILHDALNPFHYWLRHYCGQSSLQGETINKRNFNQKLNALIAATPHADLRDELERTRSFLGALLDLYWPDSLYAQLEGKARFENTLIGLITLLQAESLRQPVILLIEDAQWLDDESRIFLPRLTRILSASERAYPIAILATARPEEEQTHAGVGTLLGEGITSRVMQLTMFGHGELETLAESLLAAPPARDLTELLIDRAEGNPFFAEQILRYLQENGDLEKKDSGQIGVRAALLEKKSGFLPTDVRALLVARLDQLTRGLRDLVQAASVLGREFEVQILTGMLRDEQGVLEGIKSGEGAGIWVALSQLRYLFRHALLRDAAYRMQVHTRRRTLHRLAMEALEMLFWENLAPHYGSLGYHAEQAGLAEKGRKYLEQAGDTAKDAYQNNEAVDYFSRALALTPEEMLEVRFNLLLKRESVYHLIGNRVGQVEDQKRLSALVSLLQNPLMEVNALHKKARYFEAIGDYDHCIEVSQQVADIALLHGDNSLAARALVEWGTALWWQGNYTESEEKASQALELYERIQDDDGRAEVLYLLGEGATKTGNYELAFSRYESVLEINRELGNLSKELSTINSLGVLMNHQQEYTKARIYFEQARALCIKTGNQKGLGMVSNNLGTIAHFLGQYDLAAEAYVEALRISREAGVRTEEAIALNNLGEVAYLQENFELAQSYLEQALEIEVELNIPYFEAHTLSKHGSTLLALQKFTEAEESFHRVLALRESLGQSHLVIAPRLGLAHLALEKGNHVGARVHLEFVLGSFAKHPLDGFEDPLSLYWDCYLILERLGDPRAETILKDAYALLESQAARIPDESSRQSFLSNILVNKKIEESLARES